MVNKKCTSITILEMLCKKWSLFVLRSLSSNSTRRFNELVSDLKGISPKTLSERLKELQRFGVINKEAFAEIPPRVQYSLTSKGKELVGTFRTLDGFISKWEKRD